MKKNNYGPGRIVKGINNANNLIKKIVLRQPDVQLPMVKILHQVSTIDKIDWGLQLLGIPDWWKITKGDGIKVCLADTGIDLLHEDLKPNIVEAVDFTRSRYGAQDKCGHGTHCAGIICGCDNGKGIIGVAPHSELYVAKILSDKGSGEYSWIISGINYAISKKVDIISMSLGGKIDNRGLREAIMNAVNAGIVVVAAAGNDGDRSINTINYPAKFWPNVISVGSIDKNMKRSNFSSVGKELDILCPGGNIYSTIPINRYGLMSGTSMSTPYLSALVALMLSVHRQSSNDIVKTPINGKDSVNQVREHLMRYAIKPQDYDKNKYGFGIINPKQMLMEQASIVKTGN